MQTPFPIQKNAPPPLNVKSAPHNCSPQKHLPESNHAILHTTKQTFTIFAQHSNKTKNHVTAIHQNRVRPRPAAPPNALLIPRMGHPRHALLLPPLRHSRHSLRQPCRRLLQRRQLRRRATVQRPSQEMVPMGSLQRGSHHRPLFHLRCRLRMARRQIR